MFEYLIVGAGLSGSVLAHQIATKLDKRVLIIESRNHLAGNIYDFYNEHGILVHKYGPHIFHTNDREIFKYLSQFTDWIYYQHHVLAYVDGKKVPIPINLNTINEIYGLNLSEKDMLHYFESVREPIKNITNSEEAILNKVGVDLFNKFFKNYTKKQWDLWPSELHSSVTERIPVRTNRDNRYFTDKYQGIPKEGYTEMIKKMLNHPKIHIMLQTDFKSIHKFIPYKKLIYTGPIDAFFDFRFGKLPYRSLKFIFDTKDQEWYQDVAQINYPNDYDYTRITEYKHMTQQKHHKTTVSYEFPINDNEPFYPIPKKDNIELYNKYKKEGEKLKHVLFAGRLGTYKYYNMDQVVAQAINLFQNKIKSNQSL